MKATQVIASAPIELWGGVECTVNRVGDNFFDQLKSSGHGRRGADLELIAGLGLHTIRYPVLWELMAPRCGERIDWSWADDRLARLAALSIRPIIGLVHHGSGPRYTNLTDAGFAEGLAQYASQVAQRFPWVQWYTPVNEPLTTARFSGLYGLWYPHARDNRSFARALINQCRGTVLAMQAIRRVNSEAQLLQTEDLGSAFATPWMQYQADFENERRWITWDLLCGTVSRHHALYQFLIDCGIDAAELDWFEENPCPPDRLGINHYVTSDRFLDERCNLYPQLSAGSNGRDRYADVEAVRVVSSFETGWEVLLQQAWRRYRIPLVLSEVHLGCTREEQLRWFHQAWCASHRARSSGVDIRAVTAWALFGSYNWDRLLTTDDGHYESGAFDVRATPPRPTAVAELLRNLTAGVRPNHPTLNSPGWWDRSQRRLFESAPEPARESSSSASADAARPILIVGSDLSLGKAIAGACRARGLEYCELSHEHLDTSDLEALMMALRRPSPWAVVHAGGCDHGSGERGFERTLSLATSRCAIPLLTFSFQASQAALRMPAPGENCCALCLLSARAPEALPGQCPQPFLPYLINTGLDLLIDGESGLWVLAAEESRVLKQR